MSDSATPWTIQSMEFVRPELERVAFYVSRGSFEPRDRTQVSSIAGGFFIRKNTTKSCKLSPRASVWMQQLSMTMKKLILLVKMKLLTLLLIYILENSWKITSVQFSRSVVSDSLQTHEPQHAWPSCPSLTPRVDSNSCPSTRWCHLTVSSSGVPFSWCLQSFQTSRSFQMNRLFASGGQRTGVSASTSVLPMNTQD